MDILLISNFHCCSHEKDGHKENKKRRKEKGERRKESKRRKLFDRRLGNVACFFTLL